MTTRKRYWENADEQTIMFFGLSIDEQGRAYDMEEAYTEEEQVRIRHQQAIEAARETPDYIKAQLGISC